MDKRLNDQILIICRRTEKVGEVGVARAFCRQSSLGCGRGNPGMAIAAKEALAQWNASKTSIADNATVDAGSADDANRRKKNVGKSIEKHGKI